MIVAIGTLLLFLLLNGLGLGASLWLDRKGLPAGWNGQAVARKPDTLRPRLPLIGLNILLLIASAVPAIYLFADRFPLAPPSPLELVSQVLLLVVVDDLWFYGVHRLMHEHKGLYRMIHRVHHKAFAPVPIEYLYVHPLEWMSGSVGPALVVIGIVLLQGQMSAWTLWTWATLRALHELDIHSGLRSVLGRRIPLFAPTEHHDLHHAKPTLGNYASTFTLWDRVFGTRIEPRLSRGNPRRSP